MWQSRTSIYGWVVCCIRFALQKGASLDIQDRQEVKQERKLKAKRLKNGMKFLQILCRARIELEWGFKLAISTGWIVDVPLQNNTTDTEPHAQ